MIDIFQSFDEIRDTAQTGDKASDDRPAAAICVSPTGNMALLSQLMSRLTVWFVRSGTPPETGLVCRTTGNPQARRSLQGCAKGQHVCIEFVAEASPAAAVAASPVVRIDLHAERLG